MKVLNAYLLSLGLAFSLNAFAAGAGDVKMRCESFASWHVLGEPVKFKPEAPFPNGTRSVNGKAFNSEGEEVASISVEVKDGALSEWSWTPSKPGFYTVRFSLADASGKETALSDNVPFKLYSATRSALGEKIISYADHNVAVLPSATRPPQDIPPQVGIGGNLAWANGIQAVDDEFNQRKKDGRPLGSGPNMKAIDDASMEQLREAQLIGVNFIRLHSALWARVAITETERNWELTDYYLDNARKMGFKVIPDIYGTPKWAIEKPEEGFRYSLRHYGQAPKDLKYWTGFLKEMVARYPWIKEWELWNEPGFNSAFWYGSLDEYCELQKSGYETIKALQPDSEIWLSHPFPDIYKHMLKRDYDKYFDKMDVHGHWIDNSVNRRLEAQKGVSKPWGALEWHAIIVSAGDLPYPSEKELARRMLFDFMNQIKFGAGKIAIFNIASTVRMEMLPFAQEKGDAFTHAAGMFYTVPYIQPRFPTVVWRNFIDCFSGRMSYVDGYVFGKGDSQRAALMDSDAGRTLIFWQTGKEGIRIDPALAKAFVSASELLDWEGRKLSLDPEMELRPDRIYFLKKPASPAIAQWTNKATVTQSRLAEPVLDTSVKGHFRAGRLFGEGLKNLDEDKLRWNIAGKYIPMKGKGMASGLATRFAAGLDDSGLDLLVEVSDANHCQPFDKDRIWGGDSLQFALDTTGKGCIEDRFEFSAAMTANGPLLWKESTPVFDGYLLTRYTTQNNPVKYAEIKIDQTPSGLVYRIHIDKDELHPLSCSSAKPLRFSLLVNDNNGNGREGYLEWASGIGKGKDPAAYGTLTIDLGAKELLSQNDLTCEANEKYDSCKTELVTSGEDSPRAKVVSTAGKGRKGVIYSNNVKVVPGGEYTLSFKARGNVSLEAICLEGDVRGVFKRFNIGMLPPSASWTDFKETFIVPEDRVSLSVAIFCWEQSGVFEIKDFKLTTGK